MPGLEPGSIAADAAAAAAAEAAAAAKLNPEEELAAVKAENESLKQTADLQSEQILLYKANQKDPEPVATEPQILPEFEGMADDNVITVGDMKKIMGGQDIRYGGVVTELEFKTQHSDFDAVVAKYLPKVVKERPDLSRAIRTSGNPALLAYEFVTKCPEYLKDQADGMLSDAEKEATANAAKIAANAKKPGAASGAPGGGAGEEGVNFILNMSDDDLEARIATTKSKES